MLRSRISDASKEEECSNNRIVEIGLKEVLAMARMIYLHATEQAIYLNFRQYSIYLLSYIISFIYYTYYFRNHQEELPFFIRL